ncbi:MAG: flagellar basal-body rod protein FlgG [Gammaproteobacteria bacterium]|nr:flagellar basal-body rod protein FlgG [Gammaproteobacteria bacterium]
MNSALWISKTGLSAQDTALRTISNNLANVGTTGFKKDRVVFEDLMYQISQQPGGQSSQDSTLPTGVQLGTGVRVAGTQKQFTVGSFQTTERNLDLAIEGGGFFQISLPDGSVGYSRTGSFSIDQNGQIVNSQGYTLEPVINIPQGAINISIGRDGTVSALVAGQTAPAQVGNIQLVNFINAAGLEAAGGNLYRETVASGTPQQSTPGQNGVGEVLQGVLESSNVSVVEEMVNMVATQRAYEMNARVVSTADQMLQYLSQNL